VTSRLPAALAACFAGVLLTAQTPAPAIPSLRTIAIDPGHGGDDAGVTTNDASEKHLTLEIARRVKTQVESRMGVRVVLTREDDRTMTADERALAANNSNADLFLSLHFNTAASPSVSGAQVYYQQLDDEGQAALEATRKAGVLMTAPNGRTRSVALVPWDLAQALHVDRSAALAGILVEVMGAAQIPMSGRPLQQAPLRGLAGVNMPAALIELAYLTNTAQAAEATSAEFQGMVAQAIYDSLLRFRDEAGGER
jgi:N-acetylmuramoyl-L-alanine amidase